MKVCIAEKPSVAREIAYILGATTRHDGYLEGNGYQVTWTFGHLCTLKTPDDYHPHWKRWDLNTLPMLPPKFETKVMGNKGVKKQFATIKRLFKKADVVINCGDAGQEGELIQRWVIKEAGYKGPVLRLWISSLTSEAIRDGFQNLMDSAQFDNLYYAGFSRAIGDWLLGMNATRLFTLKYGGYKQVLSVGRVQTPTLAMLVGRYKEIENFVPKDFWELQTLYREVPFNCIEGRFYKKEAGETLLQKVEGHPFAILSSVKKKGKEYPPNLFDLTGLQVHCNKRFGYSADNTLKVAQKLYEQKVITYPRVDTTYLPNDLYPKVEGILRKMTAYSPLIQPLLGKPMRKSGKVFNDKKVTDHHAIIPTGVEGHLSSMEQNVYDAIARRFIAAFYPDCIVANTTVIGASNEVEFKATGKEILEEGWRVVFPKKTKPVNTATDSSKSKKEEEEKILPAFTVGETGPHTPSLIEKKTQPPKYYTEATLLRAMETAGKQVDDESLRELMKANGIGRPSTRANIIETLFRRNYIERKKKNLLPTPMGVQLIDTIQNDLLKSAELTGQWEKQLREIEDGTFSAKQFISGMKSMVDKLVEEVRLEQGRKIFVEPPASRAAPKKKSNRSTKSSKTVTSGSKPKSVVALTCPKCKKGNLLKGKTAYGCSQWKAGCDFRLPFVFQSKKLPETQLIRLVQKGSTIQLKGFKQQGKSVAGRLQFNPRHELELTAAQEKVQAQTQAKVQGKGTSNDSEILACPRCGLGHIVKGKTAYGCNRWKAGCDFRFSFTEIREAAKGKKLTKELVKSILTG
ncbi:DNA topoisomerase 3 [bacterium]|nr:DNA topoisomerase 3 [bacterium]